VGRDLVEQRGQHAFPPISPFTQQGRAITSALAPCFIPHANPAKQDIFAKQDNNNNSLVQFKITNSKLQIHKYNLIN